MNVWCCVGSDIKNWRHKFASKSIHLKYEMNADMAKSDIYIPVFSSRLMPPKNHLMRFFQTKIFLFS